MRSAEPPRPLLPWWWVVLALMIADAAAIGLAMLLAFRFRFQAELLPAVPSLRPVVPPLVLATWLGSLLAFRLYGARRAVGSGYDEYRGVVTASTYALVAVVMVSYLVSALPISRGFLLVTWLATLLLLPLGRLAVRQLVRGWAQRGRILRRVIVVGANRQGAAIALELTRNPAACAQVLGFLDEYQPLGSRLSGYAVIGEPMQLHDVARRVGATHAVVTESALGWESLQYIVRSMHRDRGLEIHLAPGLFDVNATPLQMFQLGSTLLLESHPNRVVGIEAVMKRALDLLLAVPLFVLTLPLVIAIVIAHRGSGRRALAWLPTTLGFSLPVLGGSRTRHVHLARLPWLWEVIRGRMSMVGPKPVLVAEAAAYEPWEDVLVTLKPGLVGPWWLAGHERPGRIEDEIEVDLRYARAYTLWMDVRVLSGVLGRVATGRLGDGERFAAVG